MRKAKLDKAVAKTRCSYQETFQRLWNEINQGQQKKILRENPDIKDMFNLLGIEYNE